ncbi:MAG: hypothetical protein NUV31_11365 [Dehalococcoidales bacterium]|jgi:hypothetical protein|nr:hypothetical protein [Dehalococcoidales bacterium]
MANNGDRVLSQAEIDAILARNARKIAANDSAKKASNTPPPSTPAAIPSAAKSPVKPPATQETGKVPFARPVRTVSNDQDNSLAEIVARLEKLEETVRRLEQLEARVERLSAFAGRGGQNTLPVQDDIVQDLKTRIAELEGNLKAIPLYGLRKTFKCDSCGAGSYVAALIKCTTCGKERWWGWWPKK